jgi:hypothetical protein
MRVNSVDIGFEFYNQLFRNISKSKTKIVFQLPATTAKLILAEDSEEYPPWYPNILVTFLSDDFENLKKKLAPYIITDEGNRIIIKDPEKHVFAILQDDNNSSLLKPGKEKLLLQIFTLEIAIFSVSDTPSWYCTELGMPLAFFTEKNGYWEYTLANGREALSLTNAANCSQYQKNEGVFLLIETSDIYKMVHWLENRKIQPFGEMLNIAGCLKEINVTDPYGYNIAFVSKTKFYDRLKK